MKIKTKPKMFFAVMDYIGQGEGRTIQILISFAENEEHMRELWAKKFYSNQGQHSGIYLKYFGLGLEIYDYIREAYRSHIPKYIIELFERDEGDYVGFPGEYYSEFHANYS